jgi:predicted nucleic acid-binding protein
VNLFLDSSVLVAASGSATGASRQLFDRSLNNGWVLVAIPYVAEEVQRNLRKFPPKAALEWSKLRILLVIKKDVLTIPNPVVFKSAKDRPVLLSALAHADVLLTLDRADFSGVLGSQFYGMDIMMPGDFLRRERERGRLR